MGKRARSKDRAPRLNAPEAEYRDEAGDTIVLRGSMSPLTRHRYTSILRDQARTTEDSWHRAVEFLFERLVVRWVVSDVPTAGQKDLLARFRVASQDERQRVRAVLREHLAANFPDLQAP